MKFGLPGFCAICLFATSTQSAEPSTQELLQQIQSLQTQVNELKAERIEPRYTKADVDATVNEVLANADKQSHLVDFERFSSGYKSDRGFVLQSDDGQFLLHPWVLFQFRSETTYRSSANNGDSDLQNGFETRRLKLGMDGNLFGPDMTYQFIWSVDRHNGNFLLEDAWARYNVPQTPFFFRAGQIRNPFDHEQIVFGPFLLTAERSMVNSIFSNGDGIVQGAAVGYDDGGAIRAELAVTDGMRSSNTNFQDFPTTGIGADWGVAGRVDWKISGDWKQYGGFSALGAKNTLIVVGAGADYTEAGDTRQLSHVIDIQYAAPSGLSMYASYLGRYVENNGGLPGSNGGATGNVAVHDTYDATVRAQLGYLTAEKWEPFLRYEFIHFDPDGLAATVRKHDVHEFTGGVNYYFHGQRARFTLDVSYLPNGSPVTDDSSGVLLSDGKDEVVIRAILQLIL